MLACFSDRTGLSVETIWASSNFKQTAWLLGLQLSVFVSTMECNQALRIADWML